MQNDKLFNSVKEYDTYYYVFEYKQDIQMTQGKKQKKNTEKKVIPFEEQTVSKKVDILTSYTRSLRRTRTAISDYVKMNDFTYFGTLTFSDKYIGGHTQDISYCNKKLKNWFDNTRRVHGKFDYLVVPEQGELNGRVHYHILLNGLEDCFVASGKKDKKGRDIYNLKNWKMGFTNFTKVGDREAVSAYVKKYITKDFVPDRDEKKRYWASKGLRKPIKRNNVDLTELDMTSEQLIFETDLFTMVKVDK